MNIEQYKELRARFKKHFPDACFFANNPDEQDIKELCTFDNGELVINPLDNEFIISDILPICGCGYHE